MKSIKVDYCLFFVWVVGVFLLFLELFMIKLLNIKNLLGGLLFGVFVSGFVVVVDGNL